ncbi:MAG: collagen-like protein, partial [Myxococcales bacterium]|nr:collagen-like protein [Myxococcales bacterium]
MDRPLPRLVWALAMLLPIVAWALPNQIIQEGLITDNAGRPFEDVHRIRVRFYDAADGGNVLFDETHAAVPFFDGYYAIAIGSEQALDGAIFRQPNLYMGLSIDRGDELVPRTPLRKVPAAFVADVALDAIGDVHPTSVTVAGRPVINAQGQWVGDPSGLRGPAGPEGPAGPAGPVGPQGPAGGNGSPDTPAQVLAKLITVDGAGSALDADRFDGFDSGDFVRTAQQVLDRLRTVDGEGS